MSGLIEEVTEYDVSHMITSLECLESSSSQEMLLQWNLDKRFHYKLYNNLYIIIIFYYLYK